MTPVPGDDHDRNGSPGELGGMALNAANARAAISRQKMLNRVTIGLGSVMGAIVATPAAVAVLGPMLKQVKRYSIDIGPATLYPEVELGQIPWHTATFESAPDDSSGLARRLVYIRNDGDGKFTAISNTCMHVGCPVQANATGFACPCHGGQYDSEGRRIAGPPVRPLNRYDTSIDARGHLILGQLWAMDNALHKHPLKPPGEPVDGPLSDLYPSAPQA